MFLLFLPNFPTIFPNFFRAFPNFSPPSPPDSKATVPKLLMGMNR